MTTKVGLVQLGCAKNQVDGEEMLGALAGMRGESVQFVADKADADVLIVNTCGFIESAKEESIAAILDAVRRKGRGQVSKVIVTGCLAQRYGSDLAKEIPEVDAFLGIESGPTIGSAVFGSRPRQINLVEAVADKSVIEGEVINQPDVESRKSKVKNSGSKASRNKKRRR